MAELSVAEPGGAAVEVTAAGLPDGWVAVQHASGRVLYLHKASRVCSWSKPYCVGTSTTVRKHRVPVGAIPCLEKWLFGEERSALAESWHRTAGVHKGLLYKLGECVGGSLAMHLCLIVLQATHQMGVACETNSLLSLFKRRRC